jgi:hypothetical protein
MYFKIKTDYIHLKSMKEANNQVNLIEKKYSIRPFWPQINHENNLRQAAFLSDILLVLEWC